MKKNPFLNRHKSIFFNRESSFYTIYLDIASDNIRTYSFKVCNCKLQEN